MIVQQYKVPDFTIKDLENLDKHTPVNIVLSGGGEKGVAHIAFLEKLELLGIQINSISAASAGSLVGAMYASGVPLKEILNFFVETPMFQYSWIDFRNTGVFKSEKYQEFIKDLIKPNFSDLSIPMFVTTTNLEENNPCYFYSGDLISPTLASCAVPAVFNPIKINNQLHSDGGVMDNFPIYPFLDSDLPILGSYLGFLPKKTKKELNTILKISNHSAQLKAYASEYNKFEKTTYTAIYPLDDFNSFDMKMALPIYNKSCEFLNLSKK